MSQFPSRPEGLPVSMHFQQWLQQGEALYQNALKEFHAIEAQLDDLETKLVSKQAEVNQIAQVIGKPPVEGNRRLSAQLVTGQIVDDHERQSQPVANNANIARALTGKFGR